MYQSSVLSFVTFCQSLRVDSGSLAPALRKNFRLVVGKLRAPANPASPRLIFKACFFQARLYLVMAASALGAASAIVNAAGAKSFSDLDTEFRDGREMECQQFDLHVV